MAPESADNTAGNRRLPGEQRAECSVKEREVRELERTTGISSSIEKYPYFEDPLETGSWGR